MLRVKPCFLGQHGHSYTMQLCLLAVWLADWLFAPSRVKLYFLGLHGHQYMMQLCLLLATCAIPERCGPVWRWRQALLSGSTWTPVHDAAVFVAGNFRNTRRMWVCLAVASEVSFSYASALQSGSTWTPVHDATVFVTCLIGCSFRHSKSVFV